jgi:glycosyltransferase involved in cell wall biosynthesis
MKDIMISIVTGTVNRIKYLKRVIENTVLSYPYLELVLVDGGSTDGTIEYIKKLNHERIKFLEVGHRSNYPDFMNMGIKASSHELVCQWNDDVLLKGTWDDVINQLKDADFYILKWFRELTPDQIYYYKDCMNYGIYKKDIFRKIGLYDTKFIFYAGDKDMTIRAINFGFKEKILDDRAIVMSMDLTSPVQADNDENMRIYQSRVDINRDYAFVNQNIALYSKGLLPKTIEKLYP